MKAQIPPSLWETEDLHLFLLEVKDDPHQVSLKDREEALSLEGQEVQPQVILGDQEDLTQINLKGREVQLQITCLVQGDFCHSHMKNVEGAHHPDFPTREVQDHISLEDQEEAHLQCFRKKMNPLLDFITRVSHHKV